MPGVIEAGLLVPGLPFEVTVRPGERLAFAAMFVQSNDTFVAVDPQGVALFDENKRPIEYGAADAMHYWDAGTEIDEPPGVGPNQAPRQAVANTGPAENGNVALQDGEFAYPAIAAVIQASILPQ
ncbi:MAG: spondin domain-containing protein [Dongiaceae bacterium]